MMVRAFQAGFMTSCGLAIALAVGGGAPGVRPPVPAMAAAVDSSHDSLLVTDTVYQGWKWFHVYCFRCHGEDAICSPTCVLPAAFDLRWSVSPTGKNFPRDSFVNTAMNGRLDKGMPSWKVLLDTTQIGQVYAYVVLRSNGVLAPGRPHRLSDLQPAPDSGAPR